MMKWKHTSLCALQGVVLARKPSLIKLAFVIILSMHTKKSMRRNPIVVKGVGSNLVVLGLLRNILCGFMKARGNHIISLACVQFVESHSRIKDLCNHTRSRFIFLRNMRGNVRNADCSSPPLAASGYI